MHNNYKNGKSGQQKAINNFNPCVIVSVKQNDINCKQSDI